MSLQFVTGNSGYGKSTYLYDMVIRGSLAHPDRTYLFVVPEQFTMQTQQEFVRRHPRGGIFNIDVLSFQRLAYRVFEETGGFSLPVLDDVGKTLVLRKVTENQKEQYRVLQGSIKKNGALDELKSILSELIQYRVTGEQLEQLAAHAGSMALSAKLKDLRLLYDGFFAYLEEKFITAEQVLSVLCRVIDEAPLVKDSVLVLDGFTGFTPLQNEVLHHFLRLCRKVIVSVTIDQASMGRGKLGEHELFAMSAKMLETTRRIADAEGVETEETVVLHASKKCRLANAEPLSHLEQNLFRQDGRPYTKDPGDCLQMFAAKDPMQELQTVAAKIRRLVRENGYRYNQIAVVCADMNLYGPYLEQVFAAYKIPCFLDNTSALLVNPMIDTIRALLEMAAKGFSYESVFHYFRCGLSGVDQNDVDALENYVLAYGIRGFSMWDKEWVRNTPGMPHESLVRLNGLRAQFAEEMRGFYEVCHSAKTTVRQKTEALYHVLAQKEMQQKLEQMSRAFEAKGEPARAKEYSQVYEAVICLLDQYVELLGDEVTDIREYKEILEAGLSAQRIGMLPPGTDYVVAGDIERTRLHDVAVLFFVGVNDGLVPKAAGNGGILSEFEREALQEADVELAPGARETFFIQKFYDYLMLTKASKQLSVSYCAADMSGNALRPSFLIKTLRSLFPAVCVQTPAKEPALDAMETDVEAMQFLTDGLQEKTRSPQWEALFGVMLTDEAMRPRVLAMEKAAMYGGVETQLSAPLAEELYHGMETSSVSRLEKYAACPYSYFLEYGLQLKERQQHTFTPLDQGNLFHDALERYENALKRRHLTMDQIEKADREALADRCIDESLASLGGERLLETARGRCHVERMKRLMRRTVWALGVQLGSGRFSSAGYELDFGAGGTIYPIALDETHIMRLGGRIDRMDVLDEGDDRYIRIIDYKTGKTDFSLLEFYNGLQLQLVVYLQAAMRLQQRKYGAKQIIPAGIFYYQIDDPLIAETEKTEQDADGTDGMLSGREKEILRKLRLDGLVNTSGEIAKMMDATGESSSYVVPLSYNKDGSLSKRGSKTATTARMGEMLRYGDVLLQKLGRGILSGSAALSPFRLGTENACTFCAYQGICGFDKKLPGCRYRMLKRESTEEIWEKIAAEQQDAQEPQREGRRSADGQDADGHDVGGHGAVGQADGGQAADR